MAASKRGKSAPRDIRGAKARAEMRKKGYIQTRELAEKLTAELGKRVSVAALNSAHSRGRIHGVLHKSSNIWFFPADTKLPDKMSNGRKPKQAQGQGRDEPVALGSWSNWQAPGFVRIAMMGLKRNYPLFRRRDLGWLGGSCELP